MRCCLIIPAWSPDDIFPSRTAVSQINYWQPLGTLYVAASLRQAGHEVQFLNGAFLNHMEILLEARKSQPDCIGIYSTAFGWSQAVKTVRDLRRILPGAFIVVGGPYPIAAPETCLAEEPWIDAAVTGEGELTMVELLDAVSKGKMLHSVSGIAFRQGEEIRLNEPRPLITDLDSLPIPARDLLGNAERYAPSPATYRRSPVAVMITSRGCNRRCIFCFQIDRERKNGVRCRSIENVLEEIALCLMQGYREIKFIDDTIASDYDRAIELAEGIRARRLDFTWFASACVNQVDRRLLRAFKEAGCWAILFGAESGVQKNLNAIRKGTTVEQIGKAVREAKDAGLKVFTPFIFGIPGETWEEAMETIEFACRLNPDVANFHALTPFPGTDLFDNIERYGTRSPDLSAYTYQAAAFEPFTLTREEILRLRQIAFRRFYSRPAFLLRRLLGLRTHHDIRAAFAGLRSLAALWTERDLFSRGKGSGEDLSRSGAAADGKGPVYSGQSSPKIETKVL